MKSMLITIAILSWFILPAQKPLLDQAEPTTRAVVIGISDYQDEKIPALQFAHRDAQAFAAYLQSEGGEGLPLDNVRLLTNEQAKVGNMVRDLSWLIDESKPGDKAVIYFSGHGDVENITAFQDGFLLGYDTPPTTYMAGGLSVFHFKRIINTLSGKNVQVVVILDACRAGKLAGSEYGGAQATTAALQEQFANEVKILSCQPDEFSWEGTEWGGGRGCFSYHLIDGLYGLADNNADLTVNLMEIENYLEAIVPRETAPNSQIPMTVGSSKTPLAFVNPSWLAALKQKKMEALASLNAVGSKGLEGMVLAKADTLVQELYQEFLAAIERGDLMGPQGKSADDYYRILIKKPELADLHGTMTRNLAAALQNEAQDVTNKLLKTDPQVVSDIWSRPFVFDHIPVYLARAAELLGEDHFYYNTLKAKQLFFEGTAIQGHQSPGLSLLAIDSISFEKLETALRYDSNAAYVYLQLAYLNFFERNQVEEAMKSAQKAVDLSPNWVTALIIYGRCLALKGQRAEAEVAFQKAIFLDSTFLPVYNELSGFYLWAFPDPEKHRFYNEIYIRKAREMLENTPDEMPILYLTLLGAELWRAGQLEEAVNLLEKVEERCDHQNLFGYQYLGVIYRDLGRFENAIFAAKKIIELSPYAMEGYTQLANLYKLSGQPEKAGEILIEWVRKDSMNIISQFLLGEHYLEMNLKEEARAIFQMIVSTFPAPTNPFQMNFVGKAWLYLGDIQEMQKAINVGLETNPENADLYYQAACLYSMAKDERSALDCLEQAIQKGFEDTSWMQRDPDLENIQDSEGFKALMKKYFPEQSKN